jgi:hypothetical protein
LQLSKLQNRSQSKVAFAITLNFFNRAEDSNFEDREPVGEGVSEMRIHYVPGRNPHLNLPEGEAATALRPSWKNWFEGYCVFHATWD